MITPNFHLCVSIDLMRMTFHLVPLVHLVFHSGTASYRLMPEIIFKEAIYDEDAEKLQKCFTPGVIELITDDRGNALNDFSGNMNDYLQKIELNLN